MQTPRLLIEVGDPKTFQSRVLFGKAACEELSCGHEAGELERDIGTLTTHIICLPEGAPGDDSNRIGCRVTCVHFGEMHDAAALQAEP